MTTDDNRSEGQAQAQLNSIRAMVTRLDHAQDASGSAREHREQCDLSPMCEACDGTGLNPADDTEMCEACDGDCSTWVAADFEGLTFDEYHDVDDAEQWIRDDALSVEVRSGWAAPGAELEPEDFQILLCTGGPAVRIMGELSEHGEPSRAWLEHQDWGTPWTEFHGDHDGAALLAYASQFLGF